MSWESPVFKRLLPDMIRTFTADNLRTQCESRGLITRDQKIKFAAYTGPAAQNEALLDAVRTGDDESFHDFLECIRKAHVLASVRKILEKLDSIDKYRKPAESATPVSKTTDPGKQDQATGSFPAGAGVATGAAAAAVAAPLVSPSPKSIPVSSLADADVAVGAASALLSSASRLASQLSSSTICGTCPVRHWYSVVLPLRWICRSKGHVSVGQYVPLDC
eukprot:scpid73968/ scgid27003/ 